MSEVRSMLQRKYFPAWCIIIILVLTIGCQKGGSPVTPDAPADLTGESAQPDLSGRGVFAHGGGHHLLGLVECSIDFQAHAIDVAYLRSAMQHLDLIQLIPIFCKPPSACLDFVNLDLDWDTGLAEVDVVVTHPIPDSFTDVYDLRGIAIFQGTLDPGFVGGSVGTQLLNADGYTTAYDLGDLYDAFLNPFIAFNKDLDRRIFANSSTTQEHFTVQFPSMDPDDTKFLYALDASWYNEADIDPEDPLTDPNMPEPYKVEILYVDPIKDNWGSTATVVVAVEDWQENAKEAEVECPELFGGPLDMTEEWSDGGRYLYYAELFNDFEVETGPPLALLAIAYDEFETQEDLINPSITIDLTSYQLGWVPVYDSAINTAPVASAFADELLILAGESVHFDATGSYDAEDVTVSTYLWDFTGEGFSVEEPGAVDHQFDEAGSYPVNVMVTDAGGLTDILDAPIIINVTSTENTPPVASAFASKLNPVQGEEITLDASASYDLQDVKPESWEWDLYNNETYDDEAGEVILYSWNEPGTYYVDVLVKDSEGLADTLDQKLEINVQDTGNLPPTAHAVADKMTAEVGESIEFDGTGSSDPEDGNDLLFAWDIDGDKDYEDNLFTPIANHIYWQPSTYEVDLKVKDSGGLTDTLDVVLEIEVTGEPNQPPVAVAEADLLVAFEGQPIHFDATASYDPEEVMVSIYYWDLYGEGTYVNAFAPEFDWIYLEAGDFDVDVRVCDTPGACDTLDVKIPIQILELGNQPPTAVAHADKTFIYEGDTVEFDGSDSTDPEDGSPVLWEWDLDGDGTFEKSPWPVEHETYNVAGVYNVNLKVTDKDDAWDTLDEKIVITVVPMGSNFPPEAIGFVNCTFPVEGQAIHFTSESTDQDGDVVTWEWDFNEGSGWEDFTGTEGDVWHSFNEEGIYFVNHRVFDNVGASDELEVPLSIFVTQPGFVPPTGSPPCELGALTHSYTGSSIFEIPNTTTSVRDLAFIPSGSYMLVVAGNLYHAMPPATLQYPPLMYTAGWVQSIDCSAMGMVALSALSDGVVEVHTVTGGDLVELNKVTEIDIGKSIGAIAFDTMDTIWVYAEGEILGFDMPLYEYNPCKVYSVPEIETYGIVEDMEFSAWNHSLYIVVNDGAGGTVIEVDYLGDVANVVTDVLLGPSNHLDIIIDNIVQDHDQSGCRIEVFGGINKGFVTRLDAELDVSSQSAFGFWGIRAAALSPGPGNEVVTLEDCCVSWIDFLMPPHDWDDLGGG